MRAFSRVVLLADKNNRERIKETQAARGTCCHTLAHSFCHFSEAIVLCGIFVFFSCPAMIKERQVISRAHFRHSTDKLWKMILTHVSPCTPLDHDLHGCAVESIWRIVCFYLISLPLFFKMSPVIVVGSSPRCHALLSQNSWCQNT